MSTTTSTADQNGCVQMSSHDVKGNGDKDDEGDTSHETDRLPAPPRSAPPPPPPDGGYGWVVVFATFLIFFVNGSMTRAGGLFFLKWQERFGSGAQLTAWPDALCSTINLFIGPGASCFMNKFSIRISVLVGTLFSVTGLVLNGVAPNVFFLFISHALLQGVGRSLLLSPAIVTVTQYFDKRVGLATGLASSGSGFGCFLYSPNSGNVAEDRMNNSPELHQLVPIEDNGHENGTSVHDMHQENKDQNDVHFELNETKRQKKSIVKVDTETKKRLFHTELWTNIPFIIHCLSNMFFMFAFKSAFTFLPAIAVSRGLSEDEAALVLTIIGVTDTFGRIGFGVVMDWPRLRHIRIFLYVALLFLIGVVSLVVPSLTTFVSYGIVCGLYGVMTGSFLSQKTTVLVDLVGKGSIASSIGILKFFQGFGTISGPVLSGGLKDALGDFSSSFYMGGGCMLMAGILMAVGNIIIHFRTSRTNQTTSTVL